MNNKILLGSIIAVVILVLVSFTGVVGYQTTKSSAIARASPLFTVRTQRAIDEESKDIACDYVGKGNRINIPLPARDNKIELFDRFANIIRTMDDNTFDRYVVLILKYIYTIDDFQEYQQDEIILILNKLRNNPSEIKSYIFMERDKPKLITPGCTFTMGCYYTRGYSSLKECIWIFTIFLLVGLGAIFDLIIFGILDLFHFFTLYNCH